MEILKLTIEVFWAKYGKAVKIAAFSLLASVVVGYNKLSYEYFSAGPMAGSNIVLADTAVSVPSQLPNDVATASEVQAQAMAAAGPNHYAFGQCTYYVASKRFIPKGWGNARSWLGHARAAGWPTGNDPQLGAIAWSGNGWYGHVALVEAIDGNRILVSEMNYNGWDRIDKRWASAGSFNYIY